MDAIVSIPGPHEGGGGGGGQLQGLITRSVPHGKGVLLTPDTAWRWLPVWDPILEKSPRQSLLTSNRILE